MSRRKGLLATMACAAVIGLVVFGGAILQSDGFFTLVADFNQQQLPFAAAAWEGVRSGSSWLWGVDLGASLVTTFSFYNLGSPFFWITLLFPKESFPALAGFLFMLKYIAAAGTGYAYLRRLCKNETAVVGALVYAFSGFQATNLMFYHFHDVVAFFPLLLMGLEDYLEEGKRTGFVFAVFLNCLVNYFFFLQEVIFLMLYFLFRTWGRQSLRWTGRKATGCLGCGLWGVCMAGILFIPSMIYLLGSGRSGFNAESARLFFDLSGLLHLLKGMLLPADTMEGLSAVLQSNFNSTSCYLPLFGIALALAYVMKKRDWLGKMLILLTALSLFPMGNGLFLLFRGLYQRWWYMYCLMMALATARVLERPEEYPVRRAAGIYLGLITLLTGVLWLLAHEEGSGIHIYDGGYLRLLILAAAAGAVFLCLPRKLWLRRIALLGMTCVFCAGATALPLYAYRSHEWYSEIVKNQYEAGLRLRTPEDQYRFDSAENLLMMTGNTGGWGAFGSTLENETYHFSQLIGSHFVSTTQGRTVQDVPELLGAKYEISQGAPMEDALYTFEVHGTVFSVSAREACPIGFAVDAWVSEEELLSIPREGRAVVMMNAFAADAQTGRSLAEKNVPRMTTGEFANLNTEESIRRTVENAVSDFVRNGHGFSCRSAWNQDRFLYFTVPFDRGWRAEVDGERAEILDSGGMMVLPVSAGEHRITFTYHTPGFAFGMALSGVAAILFLCDTLLSRRKGRKAGSNGGMKSGGLRGV